MTTKQIISVHHYGFLRAQISIFQKDGYPRASELICLYVSALVEVIEEEEQICWLFQYSLLILNRLVLQGTIHFFSWFMTCLTSTACTLQVSILSLQSISTFQVWHFPGKMSAVFLSFLLLWSKTCKSHGNSNFQVVFCPLDSLELIFS